MRRQSHPKKTAPAHSVVKRISHARSSTKSSTRNDVRFNFAKFKSWRANLSKKILTEYALPFTRFIEAKLTQLQRQVSRA